MESVRKGNKTLNELLELFVEQKYGKAAIAKQKIHTVKKGKNVYLEVEREGERIPIDEDNERWETANQAICKAIRDDLLHPYVDSPNGGEMRLTKDGWDLPGPGEIFTDHVWRTFATGELNHGPNDDLHGMTVYFPIEESRAFLYGESGGKTGKQNLEAELIKYANEFFIKDGATKAGFVKDDKTKNICRKHNKELGKDISVHTIKGYLRKAGFKTPGGRPRSQK